MPHDLPNSPPELFFADPRLSMTIFGRMFVRIISFLAYAVLISTAAVGLLTDVASFAWISAALILFLLDRLVHRNEADRSLWEFPSSGRVNVDAYMVPAGKTVIEQAFDRSRIQKLPFLPELLRLIIKNKEGSEIIEKLGLRPEELSQKLKDMLSGQPPAAKGDISSSLQILAQTACLNAIAARHGGIEISDLLVAIISSNDEDVTRLAETFSISESDIRKSALFYHIKRELKKNYKKQVQPGTHLFMRMVRHDIMNRAWTARPTPLLDRYSRDITDLARAGGAGFLVGHGLEYKRLIQAMSRSLNPNALLVGDPGIGKETLVQHLAQNVVINNVPEALADRRVVSLDVAALAADLAHEEFSNLMQSIAAEIATAGNIILYLPNLHVLCRSGSRAFLSAADALFPILKNNSFPVVATTFPREYAHDIEPRSDLTGIFEVIMIQEVNEDEAAELLVWESAVMEIENKIAISFSAIKSAVTLSKKYLHAKPLPAAALELLKEVVASASSSREKYVSREMVIKAVEEKSKIPVHETSAEEAGELINLEKTIHESMVDQDEAVKAVADALREFRAGLSRRGGPVAVFLFVGPTGVGKTELAKTLAKVHFGSVSAMIRFDMTEYQDTASVARLIGSADGDRRGALTEAVIQHPYSLVLLDEFEKSNPELLNLFLQVFDDGRLTDNLNRTVDFTNTIIIATSNAHSDLINEALTKGESMQSISEYFKKRLVDVFRPELLNRFTQTVVFKNLSPDDLKKIAVLQLNQLAETLKSQGITLTFANGVSEYLARAGFDPALGARPLRRIISDKIRQPLAQAILTKTFARGSRIRAGLAGEKIIFEPELSAGAVK